MYGKSIIKIIVTALIFMLIFCGCDMFPSENGDLLVSPQLTGDLSPVQKALKDSVSGEFTLKYPTSGNYRSAFILTDLNGDEINEAVAFYSTTSEGTVTMHLNLIVQNNGVWKSVADQKITAGNVEKVNFYDLDGDGTKEILVGWGIYSKIEKQLVAYSYTGNTLVSRLQEVYSDYAVCDLQNNYENNLLIINLNSGYGYSCARYLKLSSDGVEELGTCAVDISVTSIETPVVTKLADNTPAVQFDGNKGTGMITQLIYFSDGLLVNPYYNPEGTQNVETYRALNVKSTDINKDGIVEIPIAEYFPNPSNLSEFSASVLTKWCVVTSKEERKLKLVKYSLMNYTDGYYLNLSDDFALKTTVSADTKEKTRTFYAYNSEEETVTGKLFTIKTFTEEEWKKTDTPEYTVLAKNGNSVYAYSLGEVAEENNITAEKIEGSFYILSED